QSRCATCSSARPCDVQQARVASLRARVRLSSHRCFVCFWSPKRQAESPHTRDKGKTSKNTRRLDFPITHMRNRLPGLQHAHLGTITIVADRDRLLTGL